MGSPPRSRTRYGRRRVRGALSAPGRRGGTGWGATRRGAPLPPAAGGSPARPARWRRRGCARRRPGTALPFAAPLRKLAGIQELSAPGGPVCGAAIRAVARAAPARAGSPGTGHSARAFSARRDRAGRGAGARSRPNAGGAPRRAGVHGGAEPGPARAVLCCAVRSGAWGGAQRSGRCADRGPPRGAFQAHDIMGTGGARPMGAGPAQTRIVRPLRSAPPRPRGRTKAARLRPDPRPAGSPAGTERPGPPPRRQLRLKAAEKAALTASSRAPRPERRAPVVRGFAEVLLILLGTKGVSRCAVRLAATLQRIIT